MDHHYLLNRKTWCAWTGLVLITEQLHIIISFNVIVLVPLMMLSYRIHTLRPYSMMRV